MMTNTLVSFYILQNTSPSFDIFICKLVYKIWRQGLRIHVLTTDQQQGESLDEQLWNCQKENFIPHFIHTPSSLIKQTVYQNPQSQQQGYVVTIGWQQETIPQEQGLVINLTQRPIASFNQYKRICEIIPPLDTNSPQQQKNREKYRFYQNQQVQLNTFKLS